MDERTDMGTRPGSGHFLWDVSHMFTTVFKRENLLMIYNLWLGWGYKVIMI